jgi:hypothetical protein
MQTAGAGSCLPHSCPRNLTHMRPSGRRGTTWLCIWSISVTRSAMARGGKPTDNTPMCHRCGTRALDQSRRTSPTVDYSCLQTQLNVCTAPPSHPHNLPAPPRPCETLLPPSSQWFDVAGHHLGPWAKILAMVIMCINLTGSAVVQTVASANSMYTIDPSRSKWVGKWVGKSRITHTALQHM